MAGEKLIQRALQASMEARAAKHVADPAERAANLAKWQSGTPAQITEPTWYHGTGADFHSFREGAPTFVTQDPNFANNFSGKHNQMLEWSEEAKRLVPRESWTRSPNVMPVHVRATNPFDYDNPAHVKALRKELEPDFVHDPELKTFVGQASMGDWGAIESSPIQNALKALGHDSFYVLEEGNKNLAVYDPNRQFKSATGNTGLFDPNIPRIDENRGGEVEREGHAGGKKVVDKALEALRGNSRLTQIATTGPSYEKGLAHLAREGIEGPAIDYGAGRGHGLRSIGADTFEPYPQGWTPTYTDPNVIPDEMYRRLLNLNVLNVLDPAARDVAVANMGRIVQPGGGGIISTRGKDVMAAKGVPGPEPMSLIIGEGDTARYQKGFTPKELREYVGDTLGPRFDVEPSDVGATSILFRRNREEGGEVREHHADGERVRGSVSLDDMQFVSPDRYVAPTFDPRQIFEGSRRPMLPQDAGIRGGGKAQTEGGELSTVALSPSMNVGSLSAGPLLVGTKSLDQPIVGYRVGTQLPEGFSVDYSTAHPTNVPTKYSSDTLSLAKDILGMQVAAQLQKQADKHGYGVSLSKGDKDGQSYLSVQRPPMGGIAVMGGKEFRFAEGGPVYQSTGEKLVDDGKINWGDPNEARDFFRADAERMRQEKAAEDARKAEEASRRTAGLPDGVTAYAPIGGGTTGDNPVLAAIRSQESSNDPNAQSKTSTAGGLFGFIDKTWANTLRRMDPERYGRMSDAELSALKKGPQSVAIQQQAADYHLNNEINPTLQKAGIPLTPGNTYLGWFQGAQGAVKANTLPQDARVADVFPNSVGPNAAIKFNGKPYAEWTLGDLRAWADAKMASRMKREGGGEVDQAMHVVREHHADGEAVGPTVNQRIRSTLDTLGRSEDVPPMDPAVMGENWANAVRRFRENPVREGEATLRPAELSARDVIGGTIAGDAPNTSFTTEMRRRAADALVGSKGLPDSGTLGFGLADLPMVTGIPLQATDFGHSIQTGDYTGAALNAALPAAYFARKPLMDAGRRAVDLAREYAPQVAGAAGVTAALTPSEAEASKVKAVQDVIRAANYNPMKSLFFDYSRLHEIPKVTQSDLLRYDPARGIPERVTDVAANPDVRNKMLDVITAGKEMGGANWYNADPLRDLFIKELGKDTGANAFRKYMDLVAATSPRSDVGTNARNASYYYGRLMRGEGVPEVGERNPQPYGHMAQRLHQMNVQRVANEGWDPLTNPKPASFVENLVGNQAPVTVDTHAFRLPAILAQDPRYLETAYEASKGAPKVNVQKLVESGEMSIEDALKTPAYWQAQPKKNEYAAMERYYKSLAQELGLTPAQTQASAWVGGGKLTGLASDESKPFLGFLEDRVMNTANKLNMDPKDVMRSFIRGEQSLYNQGGTVEDQALNVVWKNGSK